MEKYEEEKPVPNHSFSMIYKDEIKTDLNHANWLEDAYEVYEGILPGFSKEEFCKSMFQILASIRSDNELQNELFEMLGFDAFELMSSMLDNRIKIVNCGLDLSKINNRKLPIDNGYQKQKKSMPTITSQVTAQLESEKANKKQIRKLKKKAEKDWQKNKDLYEYAEQNNASSSNLTSQTESLTKITRFAAMVQQQQYPHVHDGQRDVHVKSMISFY